MIDVADLRALTLFDGVSDDQLVELVAAGTTVEFAPGDVVFREAEPADVWWVLVAGSLDLVRHVGREETHLGTMGSPGQWAGGFRAWDENGVYLATGRGLDGRPGPARPGAGAARRGRAGCTRSART